MLCQAQDTKNQMELVFIEYPLCGETLCYFIEILKQKTKKIPVDWILLILQM